MKRFHVHVHVEDIAKNISFYSALFGQEPARAEGDYAKWMLEDPPVNFAISSRGAAAGVDHLGIQVDSKADLERLRDNAAKADMAILDDGETSCCYARSDKYWLTDPQGIAWEQFHTLGDIPIFSQRNPQSAAAACCANPAAPPSELVAGGLVPAPARSCC